MSDRFRGPPPDISKFFSLLVNNLPENTNSDELSSVFSKYGELADCYVPMDRNTGGTKNFCFVRYHKESEAEAALEADGYDLRGSPICVQFAKFGRRDTDRSGRDRRRRDDDYDRRGRGRDRYDDRRYDDRYDDRRYDDRYDDRRYNDRRARDRRRSRSRSRSPRYDSRRRSPEKSSSRDRRGESRSPRR